MSPAIFKRLPVYGDGRAIKPETKIVRIRFSFYDCAKCGRYLAGFEAVARRVYPTMFQSEVYHRECAPSALSEAVIHAHSITTQTNEVRH